MQRVDRSFVPTRAVLVARKRMNDAIRAFFDGRGFLEVETPIAVHSPGMEPHLFAFETEGVAPEGDQEQLYLHTSPEYAMKRMLGRGIGDCYQLARVFRNGERSRTHAPEFTMLEWYRCPGTIDEIAADVEALIINVATQVDGRWRPQRARRLTVSQAFIEANLPDPLDLPDVAAFRAALPIRTASDDTWDDLFFRAFLERVEPTFSPDEVTIVGGYPATMAALARLDPSDPRRAERFEVFVGSLELANAFGELTDPQEQRRRFEMEISTRRKLGRPVYPIDEGLLDDLGRVDSAAGIALGVDRLLMKCLGADAIQDVLAFSPRSP